MHLSQIDHVAIQSELEYLIGAKVGGAVNWNCGLVPTRARTRCVPLFSRETTGTGASGPVPNPECSRVTRNRC
jgi:hypothetical protein